jgi:hypothetical protein
MLQLPLGASNNSLIAICYFKKIVSELENMLCPTWALK